MCKKTVFLMSIVSLAFLVGIASADYINDTQTWTSETDIHDLDANTLEIGPSGNLTIDARVNMDANAVIIMSGGLLTTTGDFKCPDSSDIQDVQIWLNSGIMTVWNIENRMGDSSLGDGRGDAIYVGGGTLVVQNGYLGTGTNEAYDPDFWLNYHTYNGNPVLRPAPGYSEVVIEDLGGGACRITAVSDNPTASEPNPSSSATGVCPNSVQLSWTPTDEIVSPKHDVYFGTDQNDVRDANRTNHPAGVSYSEDQSSSEYPEDGNPLLDLELNTLYFWRVDEVNGVEVYESPTVWQFTTDDGNAMSPSPSNGYHRFFLGEPLTWTPSCVATSQEVYLSTDFNDVNELEGAALYGAVGAADNNITPDLNSFSTYYWRIDTTGGNDGEVWTFTTGLGGLLMYYKFDGTQGNDLPVTVIDDSGNNVTFTKYTTTGSVKYGESNPVIDDSTASADFQPKAGLFRADTGEHDALRLDGREYTIEMWLKPETLTEDEDNGDITLIGKRTGYSWRLQIEDPGNDNEYLWTQGGDDEGCGTAVVGEWVHIAAVYNRNLAAGHMKFYIDGELSEVGTELNTNSPDANTVYIGMGYDTGYTGFFDGLIDELRIHDIALETCAFLRSPGPQWASCPDPFDKEDPVDPNLVLTWQAGSEAATHDVYFGSNYDDVFNATTATAGIYKGDVSVNYYPDSGILELEPGMTYYWRVDEVNGGSKWPGDVWHFTTTAELVDPNLWLLYELDETEGDDTVVWDSSGRYHHGDLIEGGDDTWDPNDGRFPGSMSMDGDQRIDVPYQALSTIDKEISISMWLKGASNSGSDNWVYGAGTDSSNVTVAVPDENLDVRWRGGDDSDDVLVWDQATPRAWFNEWHHFVFIKDENAGTMSIYFDSELAASKGDVNVGSLALVNNRYSRVGANHENSNDFEGRIDDFRIYDKALTEDEIKSLFRGGEVELAWSPDPYNGKPDVLIDLQSLIWKPGDFAASHDIYFGTSYDDVEAATTALPLDVFVQNQGPNTYDSLPSFEFGEVYYWRIDEVNGPNTWKGDVWSFTAANFILIDDFESYNDSDNVIYDTWEDGVTNLISSSVIWLGTEPNVHGGSQSVEFLYENQKDWWSGHYWSEIVREYDTAQDWTLRDTKTLTLYFKGHPDNAAGETEEMFVALEDAGTTKAVVKYNDYGDANDVKLEDWTEWNIILSDFTNVDMNNVKIMWIGFGDPDSQPTPGGTGTVYFDDIRLYPPKCIAEFGPPEDISGNCIVDHLDLEIMGEEWLRTDKLFDTYTEPSPGPIGWWKLNEGSGTVAADDGSGNNDGVVEGNYEWVTGYDGNSAIDFDDGRVLVPDAAELRPTDTVSACAWINLANEQSSARVVVKGPDNKETYSLEANNEDNEDELTFLIREDCSGDDCNDYSVDNNGLSIGEWTHVAGTYDGTWIKLYINGDMVAESNDANGILLSQDTNDLAIGNRSDDDNRGFDGTIDDVRVYDYALSDAQIVYVATDGDGHLPLISIANLSNTESPGSEAVNLKDFAVLGDAWLDEKLWP